MKDDIELRARVDAAEARLRSLIHERLYKPPVVSFAALCAAPTVWADFDETMRWRRQQLDLDPKSADRLQIVWEITAEAKWIPHTHDCDEHLIVVQGCLHLFMGGRKYTLYGGASQMIPAGIVHHGDAPAGTILISTLTREVPHLAGEAGEPLRTDINMSE